MPWQNCPVINFQRFLPTKRRTLQHFWHKQTNTAHTYICSKPCVWMDYECVCACMYSTLNTHIERVWVYVVWRPCNGSEVHTKLNSCACNDASFICFLILGTHTHIHTTTYLNAPLPLQVLLLACRWKCLSFFFLVLLCVQSVVQRLKTKLLRYGVKINVDILAVAPAHYLWPLMSSYQCVSMCLLALCAQHTAFWIVFHVLVIIVLSTFFKYFISKVHIKNKLAYFNTLNFL